ncbi:MAG: helix-turn-helix domain-containing protein [Myxococcota bacterium]
MLTEARFVALCRARARLAEPSAPSVAALADEAGLSTGRFIKQFAALHGATPYRYRVRARLARARALLARGDDVTEVCFALGYSSLGSFSDAFTRHVGRRPSAFRRARHTLVSVPGSLSAPGCFCLLGTAQAAISEKQRRDTGARLAP